MSKGHTWPWWRHALNEEGEPRHQLIQWFNFRWFESHFEDGTDAYTVKWSALDIENSTEYEGLMAFVEKLDVMQRVGMGGRPLFDQDRNPVVDKVLISVKELPRVQDI